MLGMLLFGICLQANADTVYLTPARFLQQCFTQVPKPAVIWLDKKIQGKITAVLGHPYPQARLRYWRQGDKTAWILDEVGKESPITSAFLIQQNKIVKAAVLVYRESRGEEIHLPAFLQQFVGSVLKGNALSQPIDGITGATLSVGAMTRMAKTALLLNGLAQ